MKTSGIKIENFPILGEVTCLLLPFQAIFSPSSAFFPSSPWLHFCFLSSCCPNQADHHHHQAITSTCFSCLPLLLPLIRAKQKRAAAAAELRQRRTGASAALFRQRLRPIPVARGSFKPKHLQSLSNPL